MMYRESAVKIVVSAVVLLLMSFTFVYAERKPDATKAKPVAAPKEHEVPDFFVAPPPFSDGIFPCSQCHEGMKADPTRRELMMHTDIAEGFNHAKDQRWCLDCHNADDRDWLRSASGELISFEESYYLCGQCHGTLFRDWKAGVHGKRTGYWNGEKQYRLCVHCHNPHQPRFKPLKPLPPPVTPEELGRSKDAAGSVPLNPLGDIQ